MTVDTTPQYVVKMQLNVKPPALEASSLTTGFSGGEFALNVAQPAADWVSSALGRIEGLTALAAGWDGYQAKAVDATVAVQAVRFVLDHAYPNLPEPAIVPTSDGGIQIEWHRGGVDFEVAISDGESTVYVEDHATGSMDERPMSEASTIFGNVLGRLVAGA